MCNFKKNTYISNSSFDHFGSHVFFNVSVFHSTLDLPSTNASTNGLHLPAEEFHMKMTHYTKYLQKSPPGGFSFALSTETTKFCEFNNCGWSLTVESYLTISGRGATTALCHPRPLLDNTRVSYHEPFTNT